MICRKQVFFFLFYRFLFLFYNFKILSFLFFNVYQFLSRKRDSAASDSGTLQSRGSHGSGGSGLSRTPTTRSDPQEFGLMDLMLGGGGEEGSGSGRAHLTNLAQVRTRLLADGGPPPPPPQSFTSNIYSTNSTNSVDSNENEYGGGGDGGPNPSLPLQSYESSSNYLPGGGGSGAPEPNILQVYAAYETGLAQGTSVRIKVTTATTAREVVDLVIKQLNMAVILKGKDRPLYENEKLANFCLVAVIGNRERCLRDDFRPLHLQNPWKKGRLFVRQACIHFAHFFRSVNFFSPRSNPSQIQT